MKTAIIYHDHCLDGFGAAFAAWFFLKDTHELSFYKASYQESFPNIPEDVEEIYVLDFSFSRDVILEQRAKRKVFIIDHHETAKNNLEGLEDCIFDMEHSGAYLAWRYFLRESGVDVTNLLGSGISSTPLIIKHIQDRDLWRFKLDLTEEVTAGLYMYPRSFESWSNLVGYYIKDGKLEPSPSTKYKEIVTMGETILKYQKDTIDKNINNLMNMEFENKDKTYKAKAINSYFLPSETAHAILDKHPEVDIAVCYYEMTPGVYKYSLRSRKDSDVKVNDICAWLGGGGHPSAGGFVVNTWKVIPNCVITKDESKFRFIHRPSDAVGLAK